MLLARSVGGAKAFKLEASSLPAACWATGSISTFLSDCCIKASLICIKGITTFTAQRGLPHSGSYMMVSKRRSQRQQQGMACNCLHCHCTKVGINSYYVYQYGYILRLGRHLYSVRQSALKCSQQYVYYSFIRISSQPSNQRPI